MNLTGFERRHQTTLAEAQQGELGGFDLVTVQQREEKGMLGSAGARDGHALPGQVFDALDRVAMGDGNEERDGWGGGQAEDEPGRAAADGAVAQGGFQRGRRQVGLPLGQRFGSAGLGPSGPERDLEPLLAEVSLRLGHSEGQVLGRGVGTAHGHGEAHLEEDDERDHGSHLPLS